MIEIKLYKTSWKAVKLLTIAILFVIGGIWIIRTEPVGTFDNIMGWLTTFFFGLGIFVGLFHLFDRRPQIIITENGIWDRTTKQDEIKWEQIKKAYNIDIYGQKFISLIVDDTFVFKTRQYKWATKLNKAIGAQKLNLQLGQIKIDEVKFAKFINKMSKASKEDRHELIENFAQI